MCVCWYAGVLSRVCVSVFRGCDRIWANPTDAVECRRRAPNVTDRGSFRRPRPRAHTNTSPHPLCRSSRVSSSTLSRVWKPPRRRPPPRSSPSIRPSSVRLRAPDVTACDSHGIHTVDLAHACVVDRLTLTPAPPRSSAPRHPSPRHNWRWVRHSVASRRRSHPR